VLKRDRVEILDTQIFQCFTVQKKQLNLLLSLSLKIRSINILSKICRFRTFIVPGSISNEVYIRGFRFSYNPRVADAIQLVFAALINRVIGKSDEVMSFWRAFSSTQLCTIGTSVIEHQLPYTSVCIFSISPGEKETEERS